MPLRAVDPVNPDPWFDLAGQVMGMAPKDRLIYLSTLDPDDLGVVEYAIGMLTGQGWRASPDAMAAHLDPKYRRPLYIQILGDAYRRCVVEDGARIIVNLPARYGKSLTCSQWGPAWGLDLHPDSRSMLISYGDELAMENALGCRDILDSHADVLAARLRRDARRRDRFLTEQGGGILARGMGSAIRGFGVTPNGVLVCDDLFKDWIEAHSAVTRQKKWDTYRSTIRDRLDDESAGILHIHHRVHEQDMTGFLIADMDTGGEPWEHIVIPAIAVADRPDILGREPGEVIDPARFTAEQVQIRHRALGCTPAESPVLMADWTTKPISEVRSGDEVVGFEVVPGHKVKFVRTVVEAVENGPAVVANYAMESGRTIRATRDHRWFVRAGRKYQTAKIGTPLRQVTDVQTAVTTRQIALWGWLAGMIDGEAHVRRSSIIIQQAIPRNAPVFDRLLEVLGELGIPHSVFERDRSHYGPNWSNTREVFIKRSGWVMRMLLEHSPIAKSAQVVNALYEGSGRTERAKDRVISIGGDREEQVYALQTGTGNYVVWGYASSNSYVVAAQEQQDPSSQEGTELLRSWFLLDMAPAATFDATLTSWDLKMKDREAGDFVVGQVWGRASGSFWMLDQIRGQFDHGTTANAIALLAVRWPDVTRHIVEAAGSFDEVIPQLQLAREDYVVSDDQAARLGMTVTEREAVQALRRRGMFGLIPHPAKHAKPVRARAYIAPSAEAGQVHLDPDGPWVALLLEEIAQFPNGLHDDQVDAMSQALEMLSTSPGVVSVARRRSRTQGTGHAGRRVQRPNPRG